MENITCYSIEPGAGLFRSRNLAQCQRKIKGIVACICSEHLCVIDVFTPHVYKLLH